MSTYGIQTELETQIMNVLMEHGTLSSKNIAGFVHCGSPRSVTTAIRTLIAAGKVVAKKNRRDMRTVLYSLKQD